MKIGVLIDRLNVGGVEKVAIEEVRSLRSLGEDAYLVILRREATVEGAFSDLINDIPIIYLDDRLADFLKLSFKFPIFNFFSFFHISYPLFIPLVVKKNEFEYLISHSTYTSFTAITIKKFNKIKYSAFIWDPIGYILNRVYSKKISTHLLTILSYIARFLDKQIVSNSDVVLVGGIAHNAYLKGLNSQKEIKVIPPSTYPLDKIPTEKKDYILMVTAWKGGKNPEYIFELLKKLPGIKIKMVGRWIDNNYKEEFEAKIRKANLTKNIDVVGGVNEKDLSKYYAEALLLLLTNYEAFGMPALEAAGHGTTFIITKGSGVCSLFQDKIDGFYTEEKDTQTIIEYIELLRKDKNLAVEMGRHAWKTVRNKYDWQKHAEQLKTTIENHAK